MKAVWEPFWGCETASPEWLRVHGKKEVERGDMTILSRTIAIKPEGGKVG